ncbi:hypothetical protein LTR85_002090 [Meristemomyces frigidus]|nr:hypothetical protein LTR85_002090 [Meristemomyces frigidus]
MITAIHTKALELSDEDLADSAALTLVSADINRICNSLQRIDSLFATPIEIAVAVFLLRTQIGISCVAPVVFVATISLISFFNSNIAVPLQKKWLAAVQERVAYTASVLGCPKGFKMLGLTDYLSARLQALRVKELADYAEYRKFVTHRNVFSAVPQAFAPALTFMMFTLIRGGQALTPTVAFTALSLVALLVSPIQQIISAVPMFQTGLASLDRVQAFLLLNSSRGNSRTVSRQSAVDDHAEDATELAVLGRRQTASEASVILSLQSASLRAGKEQKLLLNDIMLEVASGSLTLIIGPVGSGKSTLLKAIIGATQLSDGHRQLHKDVCGIAYCAQDPWLPNGSLRDLVLAQSALDFDWYANVLRTCGLDIDITSFPNGDETIIGTKGVSLSGGQRQRLALARALYARKRLLVVDDALSGLDANTSRQVFSNIFGSNGIYKRYGMTAILATHSVQYLQDASHIVALGDGGNIVEQGTFDELDSRNGYVHDLRIDAERSHSEETQGEKEHPPAVRITKRMGSDTAQQDLARRTGDIDVYRYYARSIGWKYGAVVVVSAAVFAFCIKFPDVWVRWWSESETEGRQKRPLGLWIGVDMAFAVTAVVAVFIHLWTMLVITVPKSSAQLHKQLLHAVMRAPYSFFVSTDSGVTLNRFSNDMSLIELELSGAFMQTLDGCALCIAGAILIAAGSEYTGVAMPFVVLALYLIQRFYLRTSRQLRFMDLEAQAPLLTHVSETLAGVTTIRAFGWERQSHQKCLDLLDNSQRPYYLMLCIQRWLNLVVDLTTAAIATIVVAMAMTLQGAASSTAGSVGVSLLNILSFNDNLAYLIVAWTTLETSLGAVARCKNFEASTVSEDKPGENREPPPDWPQGGALEFRDVTAAYSEDGADILNGINLSVAAGEKVGICGRSGSGKSSLLLTPLRLLDNSSGSIVLDGVDLATLPRQTIRSRITALPQEAITVPGTLRDNIDPLRTSSDEAAREALRKVGLLTLVDERGGLESPMVDLALSQGQLQLFAVARALLRKSKLLVLDEMTSSVDAKAEELMMSVITEEFRDSAVIAVAHRLHSIVGFDKVVVMDKGRVVESGAPQDLLRKEEGWFRGLWERGGH